MKKRFREIYSTIMKVIGLAVCITLIGLSVIAPAFADDCGREDRVTVPKCVYYGITTVADPWVRNDCSHPVTLKWDQSGSDHRQTFQPGEYKSTLSKVKGEDRTRIYCCPRYNSCANN